MTLAIRLAAPPAPAERARVEILLADHPGPVALTVRLGGWLTEHHATGAAAAARLPALLSAGPAPAFRARTVAGPATDPVRRTLTWARRWRHRADAASIDDLLSAGLGDRAIALRLPARRERGAAPLATGLCTWLGPDVRAAGQDWHRAAIGRPLTASYPDRAYLEAAWADLPAALAGGLALQHCDATVRAGPEPVRIRYERVVLPLDTADGGRLILTVTALCPIECVVPLAA